MLWKLCSCIDLVGSKWNPSHSQTTDQSSIISSGGVEQPVKEEGNFSLVCNDIILQGERIGKADNEDKSWQRRENNFVDKKQNNQRNAR